MKKIIKRVLLYGGFLVSGILIALIIYVVFNLSSFHSATKLSQDQIVNYLSELDSSQSNPFSFVAEKFDTHSVVFLGENHYQKQDLEFFNQLIVHLYQTKHINLIGWEFGAREYQSDVDSIVTAADFDRAKAISVMRRSLYFWCFEEYLSVFETIWRLNKSIDDPKEKIRFLQLNKPYNHSKWYATDKQIMLEERKVNFDNILPGIVEREVIEKNRKILIYCGIHHSLTKFKTPKFFFMKDNEGRAGQRLYAKYPNEIFQIWLGAPFMERMAFYKHFTHKPVNSVYPFDGVFNQLYDTLKRPFALSSSNPAFANIKDYNSYYCFDSWAGICLSEFCDGLIMIESFDTIEPVRVIPDWITSEQDLNEVKSTLPENEAKDIHSIQDLIDYIGSNSDLNDFNKQHQLTKFW